MNETTAVGAILVVFLAFFLIMVVTWAVPVRLWIEAFASGVRVSIGSLIGMRLRKVSPAGIIRPLIAATKAGLVLDVNELEAHYLAGGDVARVSNALISADKANIDLGFSQAAAIDLAGRDVFEAVQVSVNPKVIQTPRVAAMAKDGIQLIAVARVTIRANINRLVGGAGEETILARVGEGIVSTIGSADSHKKVLENPDAISKTVLAKGLCRSTRRKRTSRSPRRRRRSVAPWRWLTSRRTGRVSRRCGRKWSRPRPRCLSQWPRRSVPGSWA